MSSFSIHPRVSPLHINNISSLHNLTHDRHTHTHTNKQTNILAFLTTTTEFAFTLIRLSSSAHCVDMRFGCWWRCSSTGMHKENYENKFTECHAGPFSFTLPSPPPPSSEVKDARRHHLYTSQAYRAQKLSLRILLTLFVPPSRTHHDLYYSLYWFFVLNKCLCFY